MQMGFRGPPRLLRSRLADGEEKGMPESIVNVDLTDLKGMVQRLIDLEVDSRCYVAAVNKLFVQDQPMRTKISLEHTRAEPEAGDAIYLRYRELLNALEGGTDIRFQFAKFVRQQGWLKRKRPQKL
jgi:hypothetical protein